MFRLARANEKEVNRRLLRIFNQTEEDWPEKVCKDFACFKQTLMQKLENELGTTFNNALQEYGKTCGIDKTEYVNEDPEAFRYIFEKLQKEGKSSTTLGKVINEIISKSKT